ncbi:MAG TPA: EAL domain-containing protein [Steroidobacteraceae bacterium]|nr:EAL domain-containing protein [Steroidobacteraceae bacterium]
MSVSEATRQHGNSDAPPGWIDKACIGLAVYVLVCSTGMLTGFGGDHVRHYVGLLGDTPAGLTALIITIAATRRMPHGTSRTAWTCLATALASYLVGTGIGVISWLHDQDPFPGPADVFYLAFYPFFLVAVALMIRASALQIRWTQFFVDATILVLGFGAFFWFLIIRPAASSTEIDVLKNALSQVYIALNCVLVLTLGVLLLAGAGTAIGRRVALLLSIGFATMFLGDILWSVAKIGGSYLSGDVQDVLYVACYLPMAFAGREQMRLAARGNVTEASTSMPLAQVLPYAAMLAAFIVLVTLTRGDIGSPATIMTIVVFGLALLVMVRQALVLRDDALIRERRAARLVEQRYASLIANASDVIMTIAVDGTLLFVSPASERTLGLPPDAVVGRNVLEVWVGDDRERLKAFLSEVAASSGQAVGPVEIRLERDRDRRVLEIVGSNLTKDPAVQGLALNFRDITERKTLEEQLRQLAFHDSLTLLANRGLFRDRVQHSLNLANRGQQQVAVMFVDLDNFKNVNDSLGHDAGDRLLQAVAQRLVKSTRVSDTVARLGGDEFAILLEGVTTTEEVEKLAASLIEQLDQPFNLNITEVRASASIGVAFSTQEASAEALLSKADTAMYFAKAAGKNRFVTFQGPMQEMLQERTRLVADIARAIANEEFFVEYQPIVDLGTRSLLGVEALVRWRHPELGLLMPDRFIQIAEECGQIVKLGRWVLGTACRDLHAWRGSIAGGAGLRVAVNISGRHLQHGDLAQDVAHALDESGLEPGNLVIELTETTIMHNTEANLAWLLDLKKLGVRLAIDDFGTGYSSLSYLHRFPIDILKIDRSFVGRLTNSATGPELARAVITLSETLGLDTVAEGIEYEPQVDALLQLGCVAGQGFLFAKSGTLEELSNSTFVQRRNELWTAQAGREGLSPTGRFRAVRGVAGAA